jgi:hypothetical protein
MIIHNPSFDTEHISKAYSKKDGVEVRYVCTSEVNGNNTPCDIFYRSSPHPEFGNRYFAIGKRIHGAFITSADSIEDETFAMVKDPDGNLVYSRFRHDFIMLPNGNMIDGGRAYTRTNTHVRLFKIKDAEFVEIQEEVQND